MQGVQQLTLSLCSASMFTHSPFVFDAATREHFSSLDGVIKKKDDNDLSTYYQFPLKLYQEVVRILSNNQKDLRICGIPNTTLKVMNYCSGVVIPDQTSLLSFVPTKILENLYDYQKEGVAFAIAHGGRCLIADEMGVGKSRQGFALLSVYMKEWPCVIVCPSSLKGQWKASCEEWLVPYIDEGLAGCAEGPHVKLIQKGTDTMDGTINIISYDMAGTKAPEMLQRGFKVVLLDESHYIKSRDAKRVQALVPPLSRCKRLILLSGTPALSRPAELFTQLHLLRRDIFSNFHAYGERYCAAKKERFGWNYEGSSNLTELNVILETTCMIRRLKSDVLSELPTKTRERIGLKLTPEQHALIEKSVYHLCEVEKKSNKVDPITRKAAFLSVWRDCGKAKVPSVIEYVNDLLETGEKFLLFAHHQFVLDELEHFLTKKKAQFIRIDGKTPAHHRTRQVDLFQNDENVKVALLSLLASGEGITLTSATVVVFAELYFTCGKLMQAEDRVHRVGQEYPVSVRYLIAEGTADERVWYILTKKMDVLGELMGEPDAVFGANRSTYDEEITNTNMKDFILAITGREPGAADGNSQSTKSQQPSLEEFMISSSSSVKKKQKIINITLSSSIPIVKKQKIINIAAPKWSPLPEDEDEKKK